MGYELLIPEKSDQKAPSICRRVKIQCITALSLFSAALFSSNIFISAFSPPKPAPASGPAPAPEPAPEPYKCPDPIGLNHTNQSFTATCLEQDKTTEIMAAISELVKVLTIISNSTYCPLFDRLSGIGWLNVIEGEALPMLNFTANPDGSETAALYCIVETLLGCFPQENTWNPGEQLGIMHLVMTAAGCTFDANVTLN